MGHNETGNSKTASEKRNADASVNNTKSENSFNNQTNSSVINEKKGDGHETPGSTIQGATAGPSTVIGNALSLTKVHDNTKLAANHIANQSNNNVKPISIPDATTPETIGKDTNTTPAATSRDGFSSKTNPTSNNFGQTLSKSISANTNQSTKPELTPSNGTKSSPIPPLDSNDIKIAVNNQSSTSSVVPLADSTIDENIASIKMPNIKLDATLKTEQTVNPLTADSAPKANQNSVQTGISGNNGLLQATEGQMTSNQTEKTEVKTTTSNNLIQNEVITKPETTVKLGQLSTNISVSAKDTPSPLPRINNTVGNNLLLAQQNAENIEMAIPQIIGVQRGTSPSTGHLSTPAPTPDNLVPLDVASNAGNKNQGSSSQGYGQFANNSENLSGNKLASLNSATQAAKNDNNSIISRIPHTSNVTSPTTAALSSDATTLSKFDGQPTQFNLSQSSGGSVITGTGLSNTPMLNKPLMQAATNQVFIQLTKAVQNGDNKITIQLRPEELGRVEVKLDITGDGRVKAMIMADKPDTLDLLQRDSRGLERALQESGLKTDNNSLSFNLQGKGNNEQSNHASNNHSHPNDEPGAEADTAENSSDNHLVSGAAIGVTPDGAINVLA